MSLSGLRSSINPRSSTLGSSSLGYAGRDYGGYGSSGYGSSTGSPLYGSSALTSSYSAPASRYSSALDPVYGSGYGSTISSPLASRLPYDYPSSYGAAPYAAYGTSVRSALPPIRGEDLPPIREAPVRLPFVPRSYPPIHIFDDLPAGIRESVMEQHRLRGGDFGYGSPYGGGYGAPNTYQAPTYPGSQPYLGPQYPGAPGPQYPGAQGYPGQNQAPLVYNPPAPSTGSTTNDQSEWQEVHDSQSGRPYYWNRRTNETKWERPRP